MVLSDDVRQSRPDGRAGPRERVQVVQRLQNASNSPVMPLNFFREAEEEGKHLGVAQGSGEREGRALQGGSAIVIEWVVGW